jgi:hypothetical protein
MDVLFYCVAEEARRGVLRAEEARRGFCERSLFSLFVKPLVLFSVVHLVTHHIIIKTRTICTSVQKSKLFSRSSQ